MRRDVVELYQDEDIEDSGLSRLSRLLEGYLSTPGGVSEVKEVGMARSSEVLWMPHALSTRFVPAPDEPTFIAARDPERRIQVLSTAARPWRKNRLQ